MVLALGEAAGVGKRVEGDLVGVLGRRGDLTLVKHRVGLVEQLLHGRPARARDGLVGADHEALYPRLLLDRLQGDDHLHR